MPHYRKGSRLLRAAVGFMVFFVLVAPVYGAMPQPGGTVHAAGTLPLSSDVKDVTDLQATDGGQQVVVDQLDLARERAAEVVRQLTQMADEADEAIRQTAGSAADAVKDLGTELVGQATDALQGVMDRAGGILTHLQGRVEELPLGLPRIGKALVGPVLPDLLETLKPDDRVELLITYDHYPTVADRMRLLEVGVRGGVQMNVLPVIAVVAPVSAVDDIAALPGVVSIWYNQKLQYFMKDSRVLIGVDKLEKDRRFQSLWPRKDPVTGQPVPPLGTGVKVAVIDSGIDALHPDLPLGDKVIENRKVLGLSVVEELGVPDIVGLKLSPVMPNTDTTSGHGTHVAGTVGGLGTMWQENAGVARNVQLVGLGTGEALFILSAVEAFDWVLEYNLRHPSDPIRVTTNSWGTSAPADPFDPQYGFLTYLSNPVVVATRMLYEQGVITLFAAGNDGGYGTINPYSIWPWVISVAAGTKSGELASFSSRGYDPLMEHDERFYKVHRLGQWSFRLIDLLHPDITAPGVDIISARASTGVLPVLAATTDVATLGTKAAFYTVMSGTSMATPHVAGVVALLLSADPSLTPAEVYQVLVETAQPMVRYAEYQVGAGYVDAYAAVHKVLAKRAVGLELPYGRGYPVSTPVPPGDRPDCGYAMTPLGDPWEEAGSYVTGQRQYYKFSRPFPMGTTTVKLTSQYDPTVDVLISTSNIWIYRPTDGKRTPRDDEAVATVTGKGSKVFINDPVVDNGSDEDDSDLYWYNLRGAFSVLTGTGGAELPRTFAFTVQPLGLTFTDQAFARSLQALTAEDRALVRKLVRAGVLAPFGAFNPDAPMKRADLARVVALLAGVKQYAPEVPTYGDVGLHHPAYVFVESLRGQWDFAGQPELPRGVDARKVMGGATVDSSTGATVPVLEGEATLFQPDAPVSRLDAVVTAGTLAGKQSRAEELAKQANGHPYVEFVHDKEGGVLRLRVMGQGLTPKQLGYIALAFEEGWLDPVREVVVKQPTFEQWYQWYFFGRGKKPEWVVELYFDPLEPAKTLSVYRVIDRVCR